MSCISFNSSWGVMCYRHNEILFSSYAKITITYGDIHIYIYILSKIQKFWPKNATFFGLTISAVLSICSMMHDKHYVL